MMSKRLSIQDIADLTGASKTSLYKTWNELVELGLAHGCARSLGPNVPYTYECHLRDIAQKVFWFTYETQYIGTPAPPYLKPFVATRVWDELKSYDSNLHHAMEITGVSYDQLRQWIVRGFRPTVASYEWFILRYFHVNLFEHIDIPDDVVLTGAHGRRGQTPERMEEIRNTRGKNNE